MSFRTFLTVLLGVTSLAMGDATTQPAAVAPATAPATQEVVAAVPTTGPADASTGAFPTADELSTRIKKLTGEENPHVAHFRLKSQILEKPADFSLFGESEGITLAELIDRIDQATHDKSMQAILLTLHGDSMNLAQAQEIRDALIEARTAGKKVFVYADSYDTVSYTLATGATDICLMAGGEIMIPGVGIETLFARGLLDKVGIQADYVQIGEYKGAEEQFTRTEPSEELSHEMNKLMDGLFDQIVTGIAESRNVSADRVKAMIDNVMLTPEDAKKQGWVDHIVEIDGLRDLLKTSIGGEKVELVADYGEPDGPSIDFSNPFSLLASINQQPRRSNKPQIAIVYADGAIIDGEGGTSLTGGSVVGSEDIRKAIRVIERDDSIKGAVIRIDSPGGSALASEVMWQAVRRLAKKKPVVVSIGSMAASGGYYLASASDHIIADRTAIVGSIGVVGGKFVLNGLFNKIGLNTTTFSRGANAELFSSSHPFTDKQRAMVTDWMGRTYGQFLERIMTTRKGKIADIDKVARGRVFIAAEALKLGMVDELGGIDRALEYIVTKAELTGEYDIRVVPAPRTLLELLAGEGAQAASAMRPAVSAEMQTFLAILPPSLRRLVDQQITMAQLLQDKPMVLMMPYGISVR